MTAMSREKGRVAMMSRMEIMVMRCAQMPGPSSQTEKYMIVVKRQKQTQRQKDHHHEVGADNRALVTD